MIGSLHGMGADQILSIQVVTADGSFITASPPSNTDIFWATRGGGGSTFGVVTSMIVKAFEDIQTTATTLSWGVEENNITADTF
jgi:FAD/FMN-containing dehydrogenase